MRNLVDDGRDHRPQIFGLRLGLIHQHRGGLYLAHFIRFAPGGSSPRHQVIFNLALGLATQQGQHPIERQGGGNGPLYRPPGTQIKPAVRAPLAVVGQRQRDPVADRQRVPKHLQAAKQRLCIDTIAAAVVFQLNRHVQVALQLLEGLGQFVTVRPRLIRGQRLDRRIQGGLIDQALHPRQHGGQGLVFNNHRDSHHHRLVFRAS